LNPRPFSGPKMKSVAVGDYRRERHARPSPTRAREGANIAAIRQTFDQFRRSPTHSLGYLVPLLENVVVAVASTIPIH